MTIDEARTWLQRHADNTPMPGAREAYKTILEALDDKRRGHWVKVGNGTTCSKCMRGILWVNGKQSEWVDLSGMPYCPACGIKMEVPNDN